jgi:hypothetical protein
MLVKVHNLNIHPYKEDFRGKMIVIPPNAFVEMDEDEADYFMQSFTYPKKDSQGRPDPLFFKKLKLEKPPVQPKEDLICHATGQKAGSQEELAKMLSNFSHLLAAKDETAEAESLKKQNAALKKDNKELKSRLDRIEEKLGFSAESNDAESV